MSRHTLILVAFALGLWLTTGTSSPIQSVALAAEPNAAGPDSVIRYRTAKVGEQDISYREAGHKEAPTILLLHGFPTSSHMFRNLIPLLANDFHLVAPDFPGFGNSSAPAHDKFEYSFDNLAKVTDEFIKQIGVEKYALYLMDYGAPVGYRIAVKHPERVTALIIQNGNAYDEGIDNDFWKPVKTYWKAPTQENRQALKGLLTLEGTKWQYTHGVQDVSKISPDNWIIDQALLDRPGNQEIQLDLFLSYGTNPPLYPAWQAYFRQHQPPALIVWGKNDPIFPAEGAAPYQRDLKNVEMHLLDTGHFALEDHAGVIADHIRRFIK